jgi:peptidoglycan/xylan/chitin deacetylase (PgdA/CDA1 family)
MKKIFPAFIIGLIIAGCIASLAAVLLWKQDGFMVRSALTWKKKEAEEISRLLEVPLLLYHNIDGIGQYSLDYDAMRMHFDLLRRKGVEVVPLEDFTDRLVNPRPYTRKVAMLTFDDGYPAMYHKLLPLVSEHRYPVTLFVVIDAIAAKAHRSLTWQQLREMDTSWVRIESHSMSHVDLVRLYNRGGIDTKYKLYEEIYLSKRVLELYLGRKVPYFAFPYGSYNLPIIDLCKAAGYQRVFSTDYGPNIITRNNYCLRRRTITKQASLDFLAGLVE